MRADLVIKRDVEDRLRRYPSAEAIDIAVTFNRTAVLAGLVKQRDNEPDTEIAAMRAISAAWSVWSMMSKHGSPISMSIRIPVLRSCRGDTAAKSILEAWINGAEGRTSLLPGRNTGSG